MLFRVCWTYENGEILVGSGSKHSDWLDIFAILQLSTPALDEENKTRNHKNMATTENEAEIPSIYEDFFVNWDNSLYL